EGAVRQHGLPVANPHARRGSRGLERFGLDELPAREEPVVELEMLRIERIHLLLGHRGELLLIVIDEAQVSHGAVSCRPDSAVPWGVIEWARAFSTASPFFFALSAQLREPALEEAPLGSLARQCERLAVR